MARRPYTAEQREARDAADEQLRDKARELIADPDKVAAMVGRMLTAASSRLLRYSLRNQALLSGQAEASGFTLTDVDTFKGWKLRGRGVRRGETGLRIVQPLGNDEANTDEQRTAEQPAGQPAGQAASAASGNDDGSKARARFIMSTRFDISQTDSVDELADGHQPITEDDPAATYRATLTEQLERFGYRISAAEDVTAATIDDHAQTITVPAPSVDEPGRDVPELARALAQILNLPDDERPKQSPARRFDADRITRADNTASDGSHRARLDLGDYGSATVRVVTDWTTGAVRYTIVRGPRVTGTFTVTSDEPTETDHVAAIRVQYGDHTHEPFSPQDADDLPTVNGVPIIGGTAGIRPSELDEITHHRISARRPTGRHTSESAPQRTTERLAATVRAILTHWNGRDDLDQLHAAAARRQAPARRSEATRVVSNLDDQIARLQAQKDKHADQAARYADLIVPASPEPSGDL